MNCISRAQEGAAHLASVRFKEESMRQYLLLILALFAVAILPAPVVAQEKSGLMVLLSAEPGALSRAQRRGIAADLLRKMALFDAYVPSLTPGEARWLDEEWNSLSSLAGEASNQKAFRLVVSPQYQTKELKRRLREVREALECAGAEQVAQAREMFCWAVTSHALTDRGSFNDAFRILAKERKITLSASIKKQLGLSDFDNDDVWVGYNMYGRLIVERIVLPYMAKDTTK